MSNMRAGALIGLILAATAGKMSAGTGLGLGLGLPSTPQRFNPEKNARRKAIKAAGGFRAWKRTRRILSDHAISQQ